MQSSLWAGGGKSLPDSILEFKSESLLHSNAVLARILQKVNL